METNKSIAVPNDSMLLFDKIGITGDGIDYYANSILDECSSKFHNQMVGNKVLPSWDKSDKWFKDGFPAQMIVSGEKWQKGKVRLRRSEERRVGKECSS